MLQPAQKKMFIIFWLLAILNLVGNAASIETLQYITKPLLLPALMLSFYWGNAAAAGKNIILTGLFFSWMGDVLLMFETRHQLFFIFGLVCFLTTHIFYIVYFLRIPSTQTSLLKKRPVLIALLLAYGVTLVWQLFPKLGELQIPVMVYAAVICSMLLCSFHIFLKVNKKAAVYYVAGAAAFVVSDSLLAINKFYEPFAYAAVLIMLTYCAAQYLIVRGFFQQSL